MRSRARARARPPGSSRGRSRTRATGSRGRRSRSRIRAISEGAKRPRKTVSAGSCSARAAGPCIRRTPRARHECGTPPERARRARSSPRPGRGLPCARRSCRRSRSAAARRGRAEASGRTARGPGRSGDTSIFAAAIIPERDEEVPQELARREEQVDARDRVPPGVQALGRRFDVAFAPAARVGLGETFLDAAAARRARAAASVARRRERVLGIDAPRARGDVFGSSGKWAMQSAHLWGMRRRQSSPSARRSCPSRAHRIDQSCSVYTIGIPAAPRDPDEVRGEVMEVLDVDDVGLSSSRTRSKIASALGLS